MVAVDLSGIWEVYGCRRCTPPKKGELMPDTVVEALEHDINVAFQEFAMHPTQSGRVRLRTRLITIADALTVEMHNLDTAESTMLSVGIADLRRLADAVLVAPKDTLIWDTDYVVPPAKKPAPVPEPIRAVRRAAWTAFGYMVFRDFLSLFKGR